MVQHHKKVRNFNNPYAQKLDGQFDYFFSYSTNLQQK